MIRRVAWWWRQKQWARGYGDCWAYMLRDAGDPGGGEAYWQGFSAALDDILDMIGNDDEDSRHE